MIAFLRNHKGFTLVELMMVIAVIGILAAVLIPKLGGVKNDARAAGVDANVRVVHAQAVALIDKYDDAGEMESRLVEKLAELENPITGESGAELLSEINDNGAAAVYKSSDDDDKWEHDPELNGCVGVSVFKDGDNNNLLTVKLTPFDADGYPGTGSDVVTITK